MVDYSFYLDTYRGCSISEAEWPLYEARASEKLARYKRIYTVMVPKKDSESMAVCAMADALAFFTAAQNGEGGIVSSASIGSVSVSYGGTGNNGTTSVDLTAKGQERELYRCARLYLDIYRGMGRC